LTRGRRGAPGKQLDPYAESAVTRRANRDAARRALKSYARALGGAEGLEDVEGIVFRGERFLASKPGEAGAPITLAHERPTDTHVEPAAAPEKIEEAIRWRLLRLAADKPDRGCKVVGGDEIHGRIAVVVEDSLDDNLRFTAAFDDVDGRLLAIEFANSASGKRVRYEYDDYRRAGVLKLPYRRWTRLDDALFAEDQFEVVEVSAAGPSTGDAGQEKPQ
jgi:hypothetical protein